MMVPMLAQSLRHSSLLLSRERLVCLGFVLLVSLLVACGPPAEPEATPPPIPMQRLGLRDVQGVYVKPLMEREVRRIQFDLVSLEGGHSHTEPGSADLAVVWLVVDGKGTMVARDQRFAVEEETIAWAPQGWHWELQADEGQTLHVLRVRQQLSAEDLEDLAQHSELQKAPLVKRFADCPRYDEDIKSSGTVSRTLLPEHHVPRMAMGTVEATGPDEVAPHRHPMLEQLFLGLRGNQVTVTANESRARLGEFELLHIPLGSLHGVQVQEGNKMHYVWMDFFLTREGQQWLREHRPIEGDTADKQSAQ
jgi:quercetin dioxygenase-like cupin family protein/mannose-6-phosphate isomerase-like protein (cupin superfamily)